MTFQGFGSDALPFFKALKFHQSREWFEANRATYESAVKGPMGDLVEEVAARLGEGENPDQGRPQVLSCSASIATCAFPPTRILTRPTPALR